MQPLHRAVPVCLTVASLRRACRFVGRKDDINVLRLNPELGLPLELVHRYFALPCMQYSRSPTSGPILIETGQQADRPMQ